MPRRKPNLVPPSPAPPTWRDPWAWASALAVGPLVVKCIGGALGEPAAEDFDMLHRVLFERSHSLLDGGGTSAFWRPVSFQLYFGAFGRMLLARPAGVAFVHACLLALTAVILYRVFRTRLPGPWAAAAASFPLLAESTRVLVTWPSQFGDLAALLFSALALHEATRRRMSTALIALALALLSKEVAAVTAVMLPFLPGLTGDPRAVKGERVRWCVGTGAVLAAWAAAYAWVRVHAGLHLPHGLESDPTLLHTSLTTRLGWAWWNSARAIASVAAQPLPGDVNLGAGLVLLLAAGASVLAVSRRARSRLRADRAWIAWGVAWFALGAAALAPIYPLWAPVRSAFAAAGLGVAAVLFLRAAHPGLAAALVAWRVAAVLLSPGPAQTILTAAPDRGAFVDFPRVTRLQLLMRQSREALLARFPHLPPGSAVSFLNLPLATEYAYGGAHAIEAWYGDPTLTWVPWVTFQEHRDTPVVTLLDYQSDATPQLVLLDPDAMRHLMRGVTLLKAGQFAPALVQLDSAEAAQPDTQAVVFLGDTEGRRSYCLAQLGRYAEAEVAARKAIRASADDGNARFVLAAALAVRNQRALAVAELDTLLAKTPDDRDARDMRAYLVAPPGSLPPPGPGPAPGAR